MEMEVSFPNWLTMKSLALEKLLSPTTTVANLLSPSSRSPSAAPKQPSPMCSVASCFSCFSSSADTAGKAPSEIVTSCRAEQSRMRAASVLFEKASAPTVSTFSDERATSSNPLACAKLAAPRCSSRSRVKRWTPSAEKLAAGKEPAGMKMVFTHFAHAPSASTSFSSRMMETFTLLQPFRKRARYTAAAATAQKPTRKRMRKRVHFHVWMVRRDELPWEK